MDEEHTKIENDVKDEFTITFTNGALTKLKKVARELGVPEEQLGHVLTKGINLIDFAKEGNNVIVKKGKDEYNIDLRAL